jgi:hypothetical protein
MATVNGNLISIIGEALATRLWVRASQAVVLETKTVITGDKTFYSDTDGDFSLVGLQVGSYEVWIKEEEPYDKFFIAIADELETYEWADVQTAAPTLPEATETLATKAYVAQAVNTKMDKMPAVGSWRVNPANGHFQLWNPTTEKYHTLYPDGPEGSIAISWGPGES